MTTIALSFVSGCALSLVGLALAGELPLGPEELPPGEATAWTQRAPPSSPFIPGSTSTTPQEIDAAEKAAAAATLPQPQGLLSPERLPVILDRQLHTQTVEGRSAILEPGNYLIEVSPAPPLKILREQDNQLVALVAQIGAHRQPLKGPAAFSLAGAGEDEHHLLLLFPDGKTVDAFGSYSGVDKRVTKGPVEIAAPDPTSPGPPVLAYHGRVLPPKPGKSTFYRGLLRSQVIVKFNEGIAVRLTTPSSGTAKPVLALSLSLMDAESRRRMQRLNLTEVIAEADLEKVNQMISRPEVKAVAPLFSRAELFLREERTEAERRTGVEHADLSNYFLLFLDANARGEEIVDELNALPSVEIAYLAPIPVNPQADIPPPTPNYQDYQSHLDPPFRGIDAKFAWRFSGGKGAGVQVIDIEKAWRLPHEDLPPLFFRDPSTPGETEDHGTAVLGVMAAYQTGWFGVTGIASAARFGVVSTTRMKVLPPVSITYFSVADAVNVAASLVAPFDIILVEAQVTGPDSGQMPDPNCNPNQFEMIPVEYFQAEFDAIQTATSLGRHVVEAAGNGSMNLDDARYNNLFNRSIRDSGAILVGASARAGQYPTCFTNHGTRVDVRALGEEIWTTGYGTVRPPGAEGLPGQWYTGGFGGTSGAAAIVAGAVASLTGIQKNNLTRGAELQGVHVMGPIELRALLRDTGTPQIGEDLGLIGPMPNLQSAFQRWSKGLIPVPPGGIIVP